MRGNPLMSDPHSERADPRVGDIAEPEIAEPKKEGPILKTLRAIKDYYPLMVAACAIIVGAFAFVVRQVDNRYVLKKDLNSVTIETEIKDALHIAYATRGSYLENLWWSYFFQQTFTGFDGSLRYKIFPSATETSIGNLKADIEKTRREAEAVDKKWQDYCTKHELAYQQIFNLAPLPPLMVQNRPVWIDNPRPDLYPVPTIWSAPQQTQPRH
jgi:hypothetical protein